MSKWKQTSIGDFVDFNPSESLKKGEIARKIGMDKLGTFQRKIDGYEFTEFSAGPKFRNNDTVVAKITPCLENGKTAFVDILKDDEVAFGSSEFIVLRGNENSDSKFVYYLARSPLFRERAISCMEGTSGRKRVNEGALKRQEILVPNLPTQQKIASVLSALDDKIELNNKINSELEAMAKTLYDYWFVQFEFPNTEGKPYKSSGGKMEYNKVLKREIPEGWEVKTIGEVYTVSRGTLITKETTTEGNYKVVAAGIYHSYLTGTFNREKFTITVSGSGANAGYINFWTEKIFASDCTTVRGENDFETFIALHLLKSYQDYIFSQAKGSAQPHVYPTDISILKFPKPNNRVIKKYGEICLNLFEKIANNQQQNQELAQLRDWLLPMLMNGQVSVGNTNHLSEDVLNKAEAPLGDYKVKNISTPNKINSMDEKFQNWVASQGLAARGRIDITTLREIFDAMDDEDK